MLIKEQQISIRIITYANKGTQQIRMINYAYKRTQQIRMINYANKRTQVSSKCIIYLTLFMIMLFLHLFYKFVNMFNLIAYRLYLAYVFSFDILKYFHLQ